MFKNILLVTAVMAFTATVQAENSESTMKSMNQSSLRDGMAQATPEHRTESRPKAVSADTKACPRQTLQTWIGRQQLAGKVFVDQEVIDKNTVNAKYIYSQFKCDLTVRVLPHRGNGTTDFLENRITVYLDEEKRIVRFSVG